MNHCFHQVNPLEKLGPERCCRCPMVRLPKVRYVEPFGSHGVNAPPLAVFEGYEGEEWRGECSGKVVEAGSVPGSIAEVKS